MWNVGVENDETRIPKDEGMSKYEAQTGGEVVFRASDFIRHSAFRFDSLHSPSGSLWSSVSLRSARHSRLTSGSSSRLPLAPFPLVSRSPHGHHESILRLPRPTRLGFEQSDADGS